MENRKINFELSELYTVAVAAGAKTPLELIDDLFEERTELYKIISDLMVGMDITNEAYIRARNILNDYHRKNKK